MTDAEYLESIADIIEDMRPFEETSSEAKGGFDPAFYADEEDWDCEPSPLTAETIWNARSGEDLVCCDDAGDMFRRLGV